MKCMGIARGRAKVRFGGNKGEELELEPGDVAVLPAGTGHQCLWASPDLMVIGAYPKTGKYDLCRGSKGEHAKALQTIPQVPLPDPIRCSASRVRCCGSGKRELSRPGGRRPAGSNSGTPSTRSM